MGSDVVMREKSFRWPLGAEFCDLGSLSIGVLLSPRCLGRCVRLYAATNGAAVGAASGSRFRKQATPYPTLRSPRGRSQVWCAQCRTPPGPDLIPRRRPFRNRRLVGWVNVVESAPRLLDLDRGAGLFELLLDRLGLVLGDPLLDGGRGGFDEVLGLLEAEARHLAHRLDDVDLLVARRLQHDVELGLLLGRSGGGGGAAARRYGDGRRRRGDAVVLLQRLDQIVQLQHGHLVDLTDELFGRDCHVLSYPVGAPLRGRPVFPICRGAPMWAPYYLCLVNPSGRPHRAAPTFLIPYASFFCRT